MFDKLYDKAEKHERVKYGTINISNDPNGVRACYSYGNSYFVLKKEVRQRCTLTDQDSCSYRNIGTLGSATRCSIPSPKKKLRLQ